MMASRNRLGAVDNSETSSSGGGGGGGSSEVLRCGRACPVCYVEFCFPVVDVLGPSTDKPMGNVWEGVRSLLCGSPYCIFV